MLRPWVALTLMLAAQPPRGGQRADVAELDVLRHRACVLRDQAHYRQAEALLRHVLARAESGCPGCRRQVCRTENDLGILYKYMGRFDEAEQAYHRALALAPDRATLADLYHNLGGLEHARQRYAAGEPWARRGLAIREQLLGPNHPDVAADLAALAPLLDAEGKRHEAAALMIRALEIEERAYGPDSCDLAVSLNNLAALRYAEGKRSQALALYNRALAIKNRCLGPDHPDVATTLNNMAVVRKAQGDRQEAARLYARALAIFEKSLGPEHPSTVACRANYARLTGREMAPAPAAAMAARRWSAACGRRRESAGRPCRTAGGRRGML